jgi:Lon protease-like protein
MCDFFRNGAPRLWYNADNSDNSGKPPQPGRGALDRQRNRRGGQSYHTVVSPREKKETLVASEEAPVEGNRPEESFVFIDQSRAPERLPIFPLPNVLLFPNMTLPLHIFEERYKRMVNDCLQGDRLLGLFLLRQGWDEEGATPTPYDVGGMGRITRAVRYPNGSMDILLSGLARVQVLRYVQQKPYLIAEIEMWPDEPDDSEGVEALTRRMVGLFQRYVVAKVGEGHELLKNLKMLASPIDLLHLVVTNMPLDVHQKQEILNLRPIDERITMMITFLNQELTALNRPQRFEEDL